MCCRTTKHDQLARHQSHTKAPNSEWRTVQRTNPFVLIKCSDSMSLAAFVVVREYALSYGWLGKSKEMKPGEKCGAKCEPSFPWYYENILVPPLHPHFTVSRQNNPVLNCPFLFTLNATQASDNTHLPVPPVPLLPAFSSPVIFHSLSLSLCHLSLHALPTMHGWLGHRNRSSGPCPISIQGSVCTFIFVCPPKHLLKHAWDKNGESDLPLRFWFF